MPAPPAPGPNAQAAAASAQALRGTVALAPNLKGAEPGGAVLFVIARRGPGPPVAVLRIPAPRFPVAFALGPEHRMLKQLPFAGEFELSARLDADGNALSRTPGDLQGRATGRYAPGARGIELLLDEVQP